MDLERLNEVSRNICRSFQNFQGIAVQRQGHTEKKKISRSWELFNMITKSVSTFSCYSNNDRKWGQSISCGLVAMMIR